MTNDVTWTACLGAVLGSSAARNARLSRQPRGIRASDVPRERVSSISEIGCILRAVVQDCRLTPSTGHDLRCARTLSSNTPCPGASLVSQHKFGAADTVLIASARDARHAVCALTLPSAGHDFVT